MSFSHLPKYAARLEQFAIWNKAFTPDECDQIKFLENLQKFEDGVMGSDGHKDTTYRNSNVMWIRQDNNSFWLFDKFNSMVPRVNYDHFMYNIEGYDSFQYTVYDSSQKQHYDWHTDSSFEYVEKERKISATLMLTGPDEYEGGELEIINRGSPFASYRGKPEKGDVVFFASWMSHKVHPVISGTRKSLVCWITGPRTF